MTFAGIDFSEAPRDEINFSGFEFDDRADFSHCKWRGAGAEWKKLQNDFTAFAPGRACFTGATFGDRARFVGAAFSDYASFAGAAFGDSATFERAAFDDLASFVCAAFGDYASFDHAAFDGEGIFLGAAFGEWAGFCSVTFDNGAVFDGVAFGDFAEFDNTVFKGRVEFTGKSKEQWSRDLASLHGIGEEDRITLEKRHKESWTFYDSGPDRFLAITFKRARFDREADFSGRTFERAADFSYSCFYYPPDFDAATNAARIDFTGAYIGFVPPGRLLHWTSDSKVPARLRALRKIAEDTKNHDLERDLYIMERKAERGVYLLRQGREELKLEELRKTPKREWLSKIARLINHVCWIVVMFFYWALADYGRRFIRPAVALGLSVLIFRWGYGEILAPLMPQAGTLDAAKYARVEWMVALGNTVPFVGPLTIDADIKKFLFCTGFGPCLPIPPEGFQFLVIAQNVLSIILVFFIGLALRNYFKIK